MNISLVAATSAEPSFLDQCKKVFWDIIETVRKVAEDIFRFLSSCIFLEGIPELEAKIDNLQSKNREQAVEKESRIRDLECDLSAVQTRLAEANQSQEREQGRLQSQIARLESELQSARQGLSRRFFSSFPILGMLHGLRISQPQQNLGAAIFDGGRGALRLCMALKVKDVVPAQEEVLQIVGQPHPLMESVSLSSPNYAIQCAQDPEFGDLSIDLEQGDSGEVLLQDFSFWSDKFQEDGIECLILCEEGDSHALVLIKGRGANFFVQFNQEETAGLKVNVWEQILLQNFCENGKKYTAHSVDYPPPLIPEE